jgi:hypothetical protein
LAAGTQTGDQRQAQRMQVPTNFRKTVTNPTKLGFNSPPGSRKRMENRLSFPVPPRALKHV